MKKNDLSVSRSTLVIRSGSLEDIVSALDSIVGRGGKFTGSEPIVGEPNSGRILFTGQIPSRAMFIEPQNSREIAMEMLTMSADGITRYDPNGMDTARRKEGWEVRRTMIDGNAAAVVWAVWVA